MADEPSWDEIFSSQPSPTGAEVPPAAPRSRREAREQAAPRGGDQRQPAARRDRSSRQARVDDYGLAPRKKPRRSLAWLWVLLSIVVVLGVVSTAVWVNFQPQIQKVLGIEPPIDYTGGGTGKVVVTIENGQIGGDVAKTLAAKGITKTSTAFYKLLLVQQPPVTFIPGSYQLKSHMSAKAALAALVDPANKVSTRVSFPEGVTVKGVIARLANLSESTGVTQAQLEAAAADYKSFGLPAAAPSLEGYLFPATYILEPGQTAHQILQVFVTEMFKRLDAAGVAPADRHRVLTLAALTQKEGGPVADFPKVAQVWDNRIAKGMNLQSDATVAYGAGSSSIETTAAQRADKSNPYNTYANPGLPVGPISNPGDKAIDATLHPTPGSWLYFVVVNCSTGETAFSDTFAQHQAANAQLGAWLKANPGGCD
ncbi:endolytic transglycosylase MltG [Lacisediminihabitans sp. H27-G8]|uniref:endolytic transglycosylase MltG n=1 Tax=Lacisediminihabitans sp. H27-G8 TaxID=3111909 RepID=UPI0038FD345D